MSSLSAGSQFLGRIGSGPGTGPDDRAGGLDVAGGAGRGHDADVQFLAGNPILAELHLLQLDADGGAQDAVGHLALGREQDVVLGGLVDREDFVRDVQTDAGEDHRLVLGLEGELHVRRGGEVLDVHGRGADRILLVNRGRDGRLGRAPLDLQGFGGRGGGGQGGDKQGGGQDAFHVCCPFRADFGSTYRYIRAY